VIMQVRNIPRESKPVRKWLLEMSDLDVRRHSPSER
jgi:hypothetical protein